MSIVDTIIENAKGHPERPALVFFDGTVIRYGDLSTYLQNVTDYEFVTSGTTGRVKRFALSDADLMLRIERLQYTRPALSLVEKFLMPFGTVRAVHYIQHLFFFLLNGKTMFDLQGRISELDTFAADHGIDGFHFAPKGLFAADDVKAHRFAHAFVAGSTFTLAELDAIQDRVADNVHVNYAASEVGQVAAANYSEISGIEQCVGRVAPGIEVQIGKNGAVRVRCAAMATGYIDNDLATRTHFHDGFFYPGDVGRFEGEFLVITGRV